MCCDLVVMSDIRLGVVRSNGRWLWRFGSIVVMMVIVVCL